MKKAFVIPVILIGLLACQKQTEPSGANVIKQSGAQSSSASSIAIYQGTGKYDISDHSACPAGNGNCLDVVVVHFAKYDQIRSAVANGSIRTLLNSDATVYYALTNGKDALTVSYINGVKNGTYNMAIYDDGRVAANHTVFLIGSGTVTYSNHDVIYNMTK